MRILGVVSSSSREKPNAPTIGTATDVGTGRAFNNGAATVTFTAPTWNGGLPITSYTATSSPGGFTGTAASSPITVAGLQSNTNYTFTVTATNGAGTSVASSASNSILATTIPQAPTIGTATAGNTSATVAYTANATGGKTVTYTATSSPGSFTGTGASPITVSGLTNGTPYTFTVTATNANGSATSAASNSVTPVSPIAKYWSIVNTGEQMFGAASNSTATYVIGNSAGSGGLQRNLLLYSYSKTGTLNWQRQLTASSGYNLYARDVAVDSTGSIYTLCIHQTGTLSTVVLQVSKWDSSGNLTWQRHVQGTGAPMNAAFSIEFDSSNNMYIGSGRGNGPVPLLIKMDTSGNVTWGRQGFQNQQCGGCFAAFAPAGTDIYAINPEFIQIGKAGYAVGSIVKYNSSGTPSRRQNFGSASTNGIAYPQAGGVVDSSGYVYMAGYRYVSSQNNAWLYKVDSNLASVSSAYFAPNTAVQWQHVVIDSSNSIYTLGSSLSGGYGVLIIAKWNTSLTLQWQRTITIGSANYTSAGYRMGIDNDNGRLIVTGIGNNQLFNAYLPTDGSGTGTYSVAGVSITYAAGGYSTNTVADSTSTGQNFTNVGTQGMSSNVSTLSTATPTNTVSITTF